MPIPFVITFLVILLFHLTQADDETELVFVRALPYDPVTDYRESHAAACTRHGYFVTPNEVILQTYFPTLSAWTEELVVQIIQTLPDSIASDPLKEGCCVASIWCKETDPGEYECFTHNDGGSKYVNYGWMIHTDKLPVYTCFKKPSMTDSSFISLVPLIGKSELVPVAGHSRITHKLVLDGNNFGTDPTALSVKIGDSVCTDASVCHTVCKTCETNNDCSSAHSCVRFGTTVGHCLPTCNLEDLSCPCGGSCYRVVIDFFGNTSLICANPGIYHVSDICIGHHWGPPVDSGFSDRVECYPPYQRNVLSKRTTPISEQEERRLDQNIQDTNETQHPVGVANDSRMSASEEPIGTSQIPLLSGSVSIDLSQEATATLFGDAIATRARNISFHHLRGLELDHNDEGYSMRASGSQPTKFSLPRQLPAVKLEATISKHRFMSYAAPGGYKYGSICPRFHDSPTWLPHYPTNGGGEEGYYPVIMYRNGVASTGFETTNPVTPEDSPATVCDQVPLPTTPDAYYCTLPYQGYVPTYETPLLISGDYSSYRCQVETDCPMIDPCSTPKCHIVPDSVPPSSDYKLRGCCTYLAGGSCDTETSLFGYNDIPRSENYFALPDKVSGNIPLPPAPQANGSNEYMDMNARDPASSPYAILWHADSIWHTRSSVDNDTSIFDHFDYTLLDASYYDDGPMTEVEIPWETGFPFYGGKMTKIYVSPNGFISIVKDYPCGKHFSSSSCSVQDYTGVIAPILADFAPGLYTLSEIQGSYVDLTEVVKLDSDNVLSPDSPLIDETEVKGDALLGDIPSGHVMCVTFVNNGLYYFAPNIRTTPPSPSFSYHMCIYGDGGIRIRYGQVLNRPGFAPGEWTTEIDQSYDVEAGGPPTGNIWFSGIRSLGSNIDLRAVDRTLLNTVRETMYRSSSLGSYLGIADEDLSSRTHEQLILHRSGVKAGGTLGMCLRSSITCMSSSCGQDGDSVDITWGGLKCGMGFERLAPRTGAILDDHDGGATTGPRFVCAFGSIETPARWVAYNNVTDTGKLRCMVPIPSPEVLEEVTSNESATVPLEIRLILPYTAKDLASNTIPSVSGYENRSDYLPDGIGIGEKVYQRDSDKAEIRVRVDVYTALVGMASVDNGYYFPTPEDVDDIPDNDTAMVYPQQMKYTYQLAHRDCGCNPYYDWHTCDSRGLCTADPTQALPVDCSGTPFGSASLDQCGVCSGGHTGKLPNIDMDCKGVCFGDDYTCKPFDPSNTGDPDRLSWLLTIVVVVILITVAISLVSMFTYFAIAACVRDRRRGLMGTFFDADEEDPAAPDPGLTAHELNALKTWNHDEGDTSHEDVLVGNEACPICMEPYAHGEHLRQLPCNHAFHVQCVDTWLQRSILCPVCRFCIRTALSGGSADSVAPESTTSAESRTSVSSPVCHENNMRQVAQSVTFASRSNARRRSAEIRRNPSLSATRENIDPISGLAMDTSKRTKNAFMTSPHSSASTSPITELVSSTVSNVSSASYSMGIHDSRSGSRSPIGVAGISISIPNVPTEDDRSVSNAFMVEQQVDMVHLETSPRHDGANIASHMPSNLVTSLNPINGLTLRMEENPMAPHTLTSDNAPSPNPSLPNQADN